MAIWNGTQADDLVTTLLATAFPAVNEAAELDELSPDTRHAFALQCAEAEDLVAEQTRALADLLCHVREGELAPGTLNAIGWTVKALQSQRDLAARLAVAAGFSGIEAAREADAHNARA